MSTNKTTIRSSTEWVSIGVISLVVMITNSLILRFEYKKRVSNNVVFVTKMLNILPLLCIGCGTFGGVIYCVLYLNGFCYIALQIAISIGFSQFVFMGLYQISRLHYCFAQSSVHSNKGYSNLLINAMYTFGLLFIIYNLFAPWFLISIPNTCGINKQFQYIAKYNNYQWHPLAYNIYGVASASYFIWDLITLSLYIIKVLSFRKYKSEQNTIYNRIMSILNRILILTLIYEISYIIALMPMIFKNFIPLHVMRILQALTEGFTSIQINIAIVLMQQHNTLQYKQFLILTWKLKIYTCCCCCFKSIVENEILSDQSYLKNVIDNNNNNNQEKGEEQTDETQTSSAWGALSKDNPLPQNIIIKELSIETFTQNVVHDQ